MIDFSFKVGKEGDKVIIEFSTSSSYYVFLDVKRHGSIVNLDFIYKLQHELLDMEVSMDKLISDTMYPGKIIISSSDIDIVSQDEPVILSAGKVKIDVVYEREYGIIHHCLFNSYYV